MTYGEYEAAANRLAHLYRDTGLQRMDHVAFLMENNPRMLECEGGAERTGLYYTCINSYLRLRGGVHRQRLRGAGRRHVGSQARGGGAAAGSGART